MTALKVGITVVSGLTLSVLIYRGWFLKDANGKTWADRMNFKANQLGADASQTGSAKNQGNAGKSKRTRAYIQTSIMPEKWAWVWINS